MNVICPNNESISFVIVHHWVYNSFDNSFDRHAIIMNTSFTVVHSFPMTWIPVGNTTSSTSYTSQPSSPGDTYSDSVTQNCQYLNISANHFGPARSDNTPDLGSVSQFPDPVKRFFWFW